MPSRNSREARLASSLEFSLSESSVSGPSPSERSFSLPNHRTSADQRGGLRGACSRLIVRNSGDAHPAQPLHAGQTHRSCRGSKHATSCLNTATAAVLRSEARPNASSSTIVPFRHINPDNSSAEAVEHDEFQPLRARAFDHDREFSPQSVSSSAINASCRFARLAGRGEPRTEQGHDRHRDQHRPQAESRSGR